MSDRETKVANLSSALAKLTGKLTLTDSITSTSSVSDGFAATPYAVKRVADIANEAKTISQEALDIKTTITYWA